MAALAEILPQPSSGPRAPGTAPSAPRPAFLPRALPLCAHCGLPVLGGKAGDEPLYCCGGCALAHRLTGGDQGHGKASGLLMSVGVGAFLAMNVMMLSFVLYSGTGEADRAAGEAWVRWALLTLATPALLLLGLPFLTRGLSRLRSGALDTDALIALGVLAAFAVSVRSVLEGGGPLYLDTAMGILLFVTIGRYLEAATRARTTDALSALVRQMPSDAARVKEGVEERVSLEELRPGDHVRVRPGERIPVDGIVRDGGASVSEAEITGESVPAFREVGSSVAAGTLALDGSLLVEARRTGAETTVARLVHLVEEARAARGAYASLVDRVSRVFVPFVLVLCLGTFAYWTRRAGVGEGLLNALSVLLIACPCAIGIAMPLAVTAAVGRAARSGVLVRSGSALEGLARSRRVFLDKTGTLTRGRPTVTDLHPAAGVSEELLLRVAAALESRSEHPVARAIVEAALERGIEAGGDVRDFRALAGKGVEGRLREGLARAGTAAFVEGASQPDGSSSTSVHVSLEGSVLGSLSLRDEPRSTAAAAVAGLAGLGLPVEVLSGDVPATVEDLTHRIPHLTGTGGLSPERKLSRIQDSIRRGEHPVMVGDGINDAPALSGAAAGVTLESGTDLAREVADVTILGGDLRKLAWVVSLARHAVRTASFNLFWAFFYNVIGLALAVAGLLHPLFGAAAMIASSLLVVLHSQRLARVPLATEGGSS